MEYCYIDEESSFIFIVDMIYAYEYGRHSFANMPIQSVTSSACDDGKTDLG